MNQWLNKLYELIATNNDKNFNEETAIDLIFNNICDLLDQNKYKEVDNILEIIDLGKLNVSIIVCILGAMHPYERINLLNWKSFYDNCKIHLLKTESEERIKRLLDGFDKPPPVGIMNIRNWKFS